MSGGEGDRLRSVSRDKVVCVCDIAVCRVSLGVMASSIFGRVYDTVLETVDGLLAFIRQPGDQESISLKLITDETGAPLNELKDDGAFYICGIKYTITGFIAKGGYGRVYRAKRDPTAEPFSTDSLRGHTWLSNSHNRYSDVLRECLNRPEICLKMMNVRHRPRTGDRDCYTTIPAYNREVKLHAEAGRYCEGVLSLLAHTHRVDETAGGVRVSAKWVGGVGSRREKWEMVAVELAKKGTLQKWIDPVDKEGNGYYSLVHHMQRSLSAHITTETSRVYQEHGVDLNHPRHAELKEHLTKDKQARLNEAAWGSAGEAYGEHQRRANDTLTQEGNSIFAKSAVAQMSPTESTKLHQALVRGIMYRLLLHLQTLHTTCNMLHLDIKPENIAINDDESAYNVCFVDFGLARKRVTPPDEDFLGTPGFVPPEYQLTPKTDVFALGITLGIMLTISDAPRQLIDRKQNRKHISAEYMKYFATPTSPGFKAWLLTFGERMDLPSYHPVRARVHPVLIDDQAAILAHRMIVQDPNARLSVEECLQHAYFRPERMKTKQERNKDWKELVERLVGTLKVETAAKFKTLGKRWLQTARKNNAMRKKRKGEGAP